MHKRICVLASVHVVVQPWMGLKRTSIFLITHAHKVWTSHMRHVLYLQLLGNSPPPKRKIPEAKWRKKPNIIILILPNSLRSWMNEVRSRRLGTGEMALWLSRLSCASRGPRFDSHYLHGNSQFSVTPGLRRSLPSAGPCGHHRCTWCRNVHVEKHPYM